MTGDARAKPLVLCVEDEPICLEIVEHALSEQGYDVLTAESGERALALLETARPDLIVLDVMLPDADGYQVCERIQQHEELSYVPVIFASASRTDEADRARAFALGAVDYVIKPIDTSAFLATVAKHVATRRRWKTLGRRDGGSTPGLVAPSFARVKKAIVENFDLQAEAAQRVALMRPHELYAMCDVMGVTPERLAMYVADLLHLPYAEALDLDRLALGLLPAPFCRRNLVVTLERAPGEHLFAVANPFDLELMHVLRQWKGRGREPELVVTAPSRIIELFDRGSVPIDSMASHAVAMAADDEPAATDVPEVGGIVNEDSPPLVRLVNQLIETAYEMGASDIHIEPGETSIGVRYRIDGRLRAVNRLRGRALARPIVSRIKVMANLDIVERRLPQDGRIVFRQFSSRGLDFDLRVSTSPVQHGEKVVLRLLDRRRALLPLSDLGFSEQNLVRYREKLAAPYGMILHVGPTGSGKSMTLYAALNELQSPEINIQTAEDPIEYTIPGISQLQVQPEIGLTFGRALRSFLRQDPDVVLVGEIRDRETASAALEAALTGHLLFSTLHTNDAASTLVRLLEMGIESYLLSSTVLAICAQRLLRRLCVHCKEPYAPSDAERGLIGAASDGAITLYRARGCAECNGIGHRGRIGVHELLIPDHALRQAIAAPGMTAERLKQLAVERCGLVTLYWDGVAKVRAGVCSLDEVLSEIRQDEFDAKPDDGPSPSTRLGSLATRPAEPWSTATPGFHDA
jgi:type IV pilus assembly protein PilB